MAQIEEIVHREYEAGNIKNKANYLSIIRNSITGKKGKLDSSIKIESGAEQQLLQMLDDRINIEKDELYFEQVKNFTNGFEFLRDYTEIVRARHGVSKVHKFTDSESFGRFSSLRELLQKEYNEDVGIQLLINSDEIDEIDKKILSERKKVMEKQIERKREQQGIR